MWQGPWQALTMYTPFHHLLKIHWVYCTYSMLSKSITRQFSLCLRGIMFKNYCSKGSGSLFYLAIFWAFTCCFLTSSSGTVLNWKDIGSYWCIMAILKGSVGLTFCLARCSLYPCIFKSHGKWLSFNLTRSWWYCNLGKHNLVQRKLCFGVFFVLQESINSPTISPILCLMIFLF